MTKAFCSCCIFFQVDHKKLINLSRFVNLLSLCRKIILLSLVVENLMFFLVEQDENVLEQDNEEEEENEKLTVFPLAKIKKIMRTDPDTHLISKEAILLTAKATVSVGCLPSYKLRALLFRLEESNGLLVLGWFFLQTNFDF